VIARNIAVGVAALLALGGFLLWRAESRVDHVALSSQAQPVSVVEAQSALYRPMRTYVGRLDPWIAANVGPQFIAAYVDTVLVRPGAVVKAGQVLATLDCRNANASSRAVEMQARALDAEQRQLSRESGRVSSMLDGGFVSANEAEAKSAQSAAKQAELLAEKARLVGTSLEVNDCILRAPFAGEVATRSIDPGGFVRPGNTIVSVIDRSTVRMSADVPENDFDNVAPGKAATLRIFATGQELAAAITRRAPGADASTRTIHIEVDLPDPKKQIPVGTTAELQVELGKPVSATALPLSAATLRDTQASIFRVEAGVARAQRLRVLGEQEGKLYVAPADVPAGTRIVTEGRTLLQDGDRVEARLESAPAALDAGARTSEIAPTPAGEAR